MRILTLGDSRSAPGGWQAEVVRLAAAVGVNVEIRNPSVGGVNTMYWADRIEDLLTEHDPDVFVLASGTNDNPDALAYGEPATGWAFRTIVETVYGHRPANRIAIIPCLIQYSDPILSPLWLRQAEPRTNDHLYRNMLLYMPPRVPVSWFPGGIADFQVIQSSATYLVADGFGPLYPNGIGIHPTARGQRYMGRIVFDCGAAGGLWPPTTEAPLCDCNGHRDGYARPTGPSAKPCLA